jgi:uncharacterized protein
MPYLERINVYPVKSVHGIAATRARVLAGGALEHDRRFAILDAHGELVNGKRTAAVHKLRLDYDRPTANVLLRLDTPAADGGHYEFRGETETGNDWLGRCLGLAAPARLIQNALTGFPDDTDSAGPTVIGSATLAAVAEWFGLTIDEARGRFRPNLEIGGVEPFWEDRLFASNGQWVEFVVGQVRFAGTNPCPRCVVPGRWVATGEIGPDPAFAKVFAQRRQASLPVWADAGRFDHHFRLATNTRLASGGTAGEIAVGDTVTIRAADSPGGIG